MAIDKSQLKDVLIAGLLAKLKRYIDDQISSIKAYFTDRLDNIVLQKGEKGDKGERGETGEPGPKGNDGTDGRDGRDGTNGKDGKDGKNGTDGRDGKDGRDGADGNIKDLSPDEIRNALELLQEDERLDKSAVKGIEELEQQITEAKSIRIGGGSRGLYLYLDGAKYGLANSINLIAGSGITLTYNREFGRNDITISNDSLEGTTMEATGTVDGANQAFAFTAKPSVIVIDGTPYREKNKLNETIWTWTAGTLTATMTIAPQSDIYGIR
jgi:hypothetical protein